MAGEPKDGAKQVFSVRYFTDEMERIERAWRQHAELTNNQIFLANRAGKTAGINAEPDTGDTKW